MKKQTFNLKFNTLEYIGFISYLILVIIDRFFIKIPNLIYLTIAIISFIIVIIGILTNENKKYDKIKIRKKELKHENRKNK